MNITRMPQRSQTAQEALPLIGNYDRIIEYQDQMDRYVTMPEKEFEPQITIFDPLILVSEANNFLKGLLESVGFEINAFYKILEVDREPKFVIDILIRIPEFNRNRKFAVLSVIGDLMRAYPNLLFDFRTTREEEISEGYLVI